MVPAHVCFGTLAHAWPAWPELLLCKHHGTERGYLATWSAAP